MNRRILAGWMAALMAGFCFLPVFCGVQAAEETVTLSTPEEWVTFLKSCNSDQFSRGRRFVLLNDIDLTETEVVPATIFCGTLSGNGYAVKGVKIQAGDETSGIFNRISADGIIRDVNFEGEVQTKPSESTGMSVDEVVGGLMKNAGISGISPTETTGNLGGVAGTNEGQLINVSFSGKVAGKRHTGGIVGENKETGILDMCKNTAEVSGLEMTGGIAGANSGRIKSSVNAGEICKSAGETDRDIGGIAGFSEGVIELCTNEGTTGCKGFGINTGGIAGRQSGCILDSVNKGMVLGKKNTGGIVGMFIPYTDLTMSIDELRQDVKEQKDNIKKDVQETKDDLKKQADALLSDISGLADIGAKLGIGTLLPSLLEAGGVLGNSASRQGILDSLQNTIDSFGSGAQSIAESVEDISGRLSEDTEESLDLLNSLLQASLDDVNTVKDDLQTLGEHLDNWTADGEQDLEDAKAQISEVLDGVQVVLASVDRAANGLNSAATAIKRVVQGLRNDLGDAADAICAPFEALEDIIEDAEKKFTALHKTLEDLAQKIEDKLEEIEDKVEKKKEEAPSVWEKIFPVSSVYAEEASLVDVLDTEQIKEELKKVISVDVSLDRQVAGSYADNALVRYCINEGEISGGSNAGGVVGNMSVESLKKNGNVLSFPDGKAITSGMLIKAHVNACISTGDVLAKADHSGGIAGNATVGTIKNCLGTGRITVSDGGYAGGISGETFAAVENCIAVAELQGKADIGGIAGKSGGITGCYALPTMETGIERSGGIAGSAEGTLTDNYFIDEGLGGVGGSSYDRSAQALPFSDMTGSEIIPEKMVGFSDTVWMMEKGAVCFPQLRFLAENDARIGDQMKALSSYYASTAFKVRFFSGETLLKELTASYGEVLPKEEIPVLEKRDGFYPFWDKNTEQPILRHTTFRAVYDKAVTTIASGETPPILLLEGNFSEESKVEVEPTEISQGCEGKYEKGVAYRFTVTPVHDVDGEFKMHVLDERGEGDAIAVLKDGRLETISCSREGRYLICEMEEVLPFVILNKKGYRLWLLGIGFLGLCLLSGGIYLGIRWIKCK